MPFGIYHKIRIPCGESGKEHMEVISETQKKKEYLYSFISLQNEIRYIEEQIEEFNIRHINSRTQNYDSIGSGIRTSDISDVLTEGERLLQKWKDARSRKIKKCLEIYFQIDSMKNQDEKSVLMMHYLQRLPFTVIADKMRFSIRHIYRIHGQALNNFKLPEEEDDGAT